MTRAEVVTVSVLHDFMDKSSRTVEYVEPGEAVVEYCPADLREDAGLRIAYNGWLLNEEQARVLKARTGDFVEFYALPGTLADIGVTLLVGLILTGISYAISALTAPTVDALEEGQEDSPTYGFGGLRNTVRPGTRMSLPYGTHRVAGHIIQQFLRPAEDSGGVIKDAEVGELWTLVALGSGEIDDVSSIRVDENQIENFGGEVKYEVRLGLEHQSAIEGFHDIVTQRSVDLPLTASTPVTASLPQAQIDSYQLVFRFPAGLFRAGDRGQLNQNQVKIRIEHRESKQDGTFGAWVFAGEKRVANRTRNAFDAFFRSPPLLRAFYEVRATRTTPDETSVQGVSNVQVASVNLISEDTLTYPGIPLLGVGQLPTSQVSGRAPTYDCIVRGRKVRVYSDTSTYAVTWSDNPAWVLLDVLIDKRDGLGAFIDASKCDIQSFIDWAGFCDELVAKDSSGVLEKRYVCDIIVDGSLDAIDVVKQITSIGQAFFLLKGNKWSIKIDRDEVPTQQLTMGRILKGSFSVQHDGKLDKANYILGQYRNADLEYDSDELPAEDATLTATDAQVEETINMAGATRTSHVARLLNYHILHNRLVKRTVEFEVGVAQITMEAGDVFRLAHDVPGWGFSGILQSIDETGTLLGLDRDVTIEAGKSYEMTFAHPDDTIDTVFVVTGAGTTSRVGVAGEWTTVPVAGAFYSFGEVEKSVVLMRCTSITKGSAPWRRTIRAREHDPNVYGTDLTVLPAPLPTRLVNPFQIPAPVTNLRLAERQVFAEDGTISATIDAHFTLPIVAQVRAEVYWREVGDDLWESAGVTNIGLFTIRENVQSPDATYEVSVVTLSVNGNKRHPDAGQQATITTQGSTRRPDGVTGFRAARTAIGLLFSWNELDRLRNFDLSYYEVREGTAWDSAILLGRTPNTNLETSIFIQGTRTFLVKAVNTAGNESVNAAGIVFDVDGRINENIVITSSEEPGWSGDKQNFTVDSNKLILDSSAAVVAWRARQSVNQFGSGLLSGGRGTTFAVTGIYTTQKVQITTGDAVRTIFSTDILFETVDPALFWTATGVGDKTWESQFGKTHAWAAVSVDKVAVKLEMRFSADTSADGDFSAWQERPQNVEFLAKWAQARVTVTLKDPSLIVRFTSLKILADVPELVESGEVTSSGTSTVTVTLSKAFNNAPKVALTILDTQGAGEYSDLTNLTKTGFDVAVRDNADALIAGRVVEWIAVGY